VHSKGVRPAVDLPAPATSIVICAYTEDRWGDLLDAIASVRAQDPRPGEVLVVVDHNESLLDRLRHVVTADVRVVANVGPRGLSAARNTGAQMAQGDVVVFLDDDARARPGWLGALLAAYEPGVIAVGGTALPDWEGRRPAWFPSEFDWVVGCSYLGQPSGRAEVRNVIGASMSFSSAALRAAGSFDSRLGRVGSRPIGDEETELSIRARRAIPGGRILLEPMAMVDHRVPLARQSVGYFIARCFAEGRSKARLAYIVGGDAALESERVYVRDVLTAGVVRGVRDMVRGDVSGAARAIAILAGLAATTVGFLAGLLSPSARRQGRRILGDPT
jgi:glucosyl-dolichyl phosphate glucuronosyltransferase